MNGIHDPTNEDVHPELPGNETITQLARRHLKDMSHTTTDEELRNAKIELSNIRVNKNNAYTITSCTINNSI